MLTPFSHPPTISGTIDLESKLNTFCSDKKVKHSAFVLPLWCSVCRVIPGIAVSYCAAWEGNARTGGGGGGYRRACQPSRCVGNRQRFCWGKRCGWEREEVAS